MTLQVRRIHDDEWQPLRALRLRALADAPMAFSSSLAREEGFSDDLWRERAIAGAAGADRVTFIAESDGRWVGLATGLLPGAPGSDVTVPTLVGMFVDRSARRQGAGAALIEQIAAWVRERGESRLALWVTSSNEAAIALYRRCAFQATGATRPLAHTPDPERAGDGARALISGRQLDDLAAQRAVGHDQTSHGDGELEAARPCAAGIEIEHARQLLVPGLMRMPEHNGGKSLAGQIDVDHAEIVQHENLQAFDLHGLPLRQPLRPGGTVDIAANGGHRCDPRQMCENVGVADIARMDDPIAAA
jgi:GNAT superfamily N-acetyltransferase